MKIQNFVLVNVNAAIGFRFSEFKRMGNDRRNLKNTGFCVMVKDVDADREMELSPKASFS